MNIKSKLKSLFNSIDIVEVKDDPYVNHLETEVIYLRTQNATLLDKIGSLPITPVISNTEDEDVKIEEMKPLRGIESVSQLKRRLEVADLAKHLEERKKANERV